MNDKQYQQSPVSHRAWRSVVVLAAVLFFAVSAVRAQYTPGSTYGGRSNYIVYAAGDLPFILSAPHGGTLTPSEIPDRTNCASCSSWDFTTTTDSSTDDVASKVWTEVANLTGHRPHIIICYLSRAKIDCNREVVEGAQGKAAAVTAWNEFQNFIDYSSNYAIANFSRGFYIDQHGQGHPEGRLEIGYLLDKYDLTNTDSYMDSHPSTFKNQSTIRTLANSVSNQLSFSKLLRGTNSFGEMMVNEGYPATPSYTTPAPFTNPSSSTAFFNGGYNTAVHGSDNQGPLDGLQIEANYTGVRDTSANRTAYAQSLARVVEKYFQAYYGISLRSCAPSVWDSGTGSWGTSANWALSLVPVSSNYLAFAGAGGTATHNVTALTTGNGVVYGIIFSNAATAAYTLSGNAFTLVDGVTNENTFTNTINNIVTLPGNQRFAVNAGALTVNGVLSGAGGLTKSGAGTLVLTGTNAYTGPTTNLAGPISVNGSATFGDGSGLLVLAGGDILSISSRSTAPLSNPVLMTASTTIYGNSVQTNVARYLPFSADSIVTTGGTLTLRNVGTNTFATNNYFRVRFTGGGFNFSQPIVLGSPLDLTNTISQIESYNDSATADQTFSGPISGPGSLRRDAPDAGGRTILSGSNTYVGGTTVSAGTLLVNNTAGSGTGSGAVSVSAGATLGGNGTVAGATTCTGWLAAGPMGKLTFGGGLNLSGGGTNLWELSALSESGPGTNFDQVALTGGNLTLGGTSKLRLSFTNSASAPATSNSFWMMSHTWKIVALSGAATNPGATKFATLQNASYASGSFTNYVDASGSVILAYVATTPARPVVSAFRSANGGGFNLTFSSETNRTYLLQSLTNLGATNWVTVSTNVATSNPFTVSNLNYADPTRFFRLVAVP